MSRASLLVRLPLYCSAECATPTNSSLFLQIFRGICPMPLSLLNHSALALFAQRTRIPTSARSIGFCAIWVCISSSSSYLEDDAGGHGVDVVGEAPCMQVEEGSDVGLVAECCAACGDPVGAVLHRNCAARLLCRYLRLFCLYFRESAVCGGRALGGDSGCGRFCVEFLETFS